MTDLLHDPPDLQSALACLLEQVPSGRVTTYGRLAEALGAGVAARWVGSFLLHWPRVAELKVHRVVRADGQLGSYYTGEVREKAARLRAEGIVVQGMAVDLDRFGFERFDTERPLLGLRRLQSRLSQRLILEPPERLPRFVAGVDVSYRSATGETEGVAAYALVDFPGGNLVWSTTVRRPVRFPYISTLLAFRELPILLDLFDQVSANDRMAEVLLVDGSGIMHQRHAGIATHLGVALDRPTIGVTKKLLFGRVEPRGKPGEPRAVRDDGGVIGLAIDPTSTAIKPIFVSPGHRADVAFSGQVVGALLKGHRLPEPIYWADRLSRREARQTAATLKPSVSRGDASGA